MEKVKGSISKSYTPIRLYLDDLHEIEGILRIASKTINFIANGYSYDSLTELRDHRQQTTISNLEISTHGPTSTLRSSDRR